MSGESIKRGCLEIFWGAIAIVLFFLVLGLWRGSNKSPPNPTPTSSQCQQIRNDTAAATRNLSQRMIQDGIRNDSVEINQDCTEAIFNITLMNNLSEIDKDVLTNEFIPAMAASRCESDSIKNIHRAGLSTIFNLHTIDNVTIGKLTLHPSDCPISSTGAIRFTSYISTHSSPSPQPPVDQKRQRASDISELERVRRESGWSAADNNQPARDSRHPRSRSSNSEYNETSESRTSQSRHPTDHHNNGSIPGSHKIWDYRTGREIWVDANGTPLDH